MKVVERCICIQSLLLIILGELVWYLNLHLKTSHPDWTFQYLIHDYGVL